MEEADFHEDILADLLICHMPFLILVDLGQILFGKVLYLL